MSHSKGATYELDPTYYTDNGCVHNPVPKGCLNCPFPECCHDNPKLFQYSKRDQEIQGLANQGLHYLEIAKMMNMHDRSILRSLARSRERRANAKV